MKTIALIVAAGNSSRLPGDRPKPYRLLNGKPVVRWSIEAFLAHPQVDAVAVVVNPAHQAYYAEMAPLLVIEGGAERQDSVRRGLEAIERLEPKRVLIHDAARPGITAALIDRLLQAMENERAVIPVVPVVDTIKRVEAGRVMETLPRAQLAAVQTPQGFDFQAILAAHRRFAGEAMTDDAALAEAAGIRVATVTGEPGNGKLTTQEDWRRMEQEETRTGMGFDVHRLIEDKARPLMLCGVEITGPLALDGHSDADVGLHALTDALLGALALGDIGTHFPPSDLQWKNTDSALFVREAMRLLQERQGRLIHADITLICERPKIAPYREAMRERLAAMLKTDKDRISVKATTTEGLGFTGRGEGVAAQAVVTVRF